MYSFDFALAASFNFSNPAETHRLNKRETALELLFSSPNLSLTDAVVALLPRMYMAHACR